MSGKKKNELSVTEVTCLLLQNLSALDLEIKLNVLIIGNKNMNWFLQYFLDVKMLLLWSHLYSFCHETWKPFQWPSGQLQLLHSLLNGTLLVLKEERYAGKAGRDGELVQSLHPDGTQNTFSHGSIFSGGFFPPALYAGASDLKYLHQYTAVFPLLRLHRGGSICRTGP